jgi:hypothetical protein
MTFMGKFKDYIFIFGSMFVSLTAIMVLLAMIEPRVFSLVPGAVPDSLYASPDSAALSAYADSVLAHREGHAVAQKHVVDSTGFPPRTNEHIAAQHKDEEIDSSKTKNIGDTVALPSTASVGPDTLSESEQKKMAQIFESMDAENASRILTNMSDAAVRQVLTVMKKRQSAKILATLEPKYAARILRGKLP